MEENETQATETQAIEESPAPGPGLLRKLSMLAFMVVVVVAECLFSYLYIPSAEQTVAMSRVSQEVVPGIEDLDALIAEEAANNNNVDNVEVDMGEFSVTAFQPKSSSTLRIDFLLFGTVERDDAGEFAELFEENQHRIRDQVIITVRSADFNDFEDPGLGLIRRRILDKTNRMIGKPYLKAVVFSEFSFIEQ